MFYVKRDVNGVIEAVSRHSDEQFTESMDIDAAELQQFLSEDELFNIAKQHLSETDANMVRVLEDLIEVLVAKNIIQFTELPEGAQDKILKRKKLRFLLSNLINNDDKIG